MTSHDFQQLCFRIMENRHLTSLEKHVAMAQALYEDNPTPMRIADGTGIPLGMVEFVLGELARKTTEAHQ